MKRWNDDMIRRRRLPADVRGLLHDLCWHMDKTPVSNYVQRAREIMMRDNTAGDPHESCIADSGGAVSGAGRDTDSQPESEGQCGAEPANLLDVAQLPNGTVEQRMNRARLGLS